MSTQAQESFIKSLKDVEKALSNIGLSHFSTTKKGYATYINYKGKDNTLVTFMFGPSDWNVEILLEINETKYAFKDLLQISSIGRIGKGISAQALHRTVLETLTSHGSSLSA